MPPAKKKDGQFLEQMRLKIAPLDMQEIVIPIVQMEPLVQQRMTEKAIRAMQETQEAGEHANKTRAKTKRDFKEDYENAPHKGPNGEYGFNAAAIRSALISVCRVCGVKMTHAKLCLFVIPDFYDPRSGIPLVKITGKPRPFMSAVRNANGNADLRNRPIWDKWSANVRIQYDRGQFSPEDVLNLLYRAGSQVGIGEGRPDSKKSAGCGWGRFAIDPKVFEKRSPRGKRAA
jgi:hypothetical protein